MGGSIFDPYDRTVRLSLGTGCEVHALLHVGESSAKPKIMLLHGNPGSLRDWEHLLPLLSSAADVVAIDLPGFGRSPRPGRGPECLSLEELAGHAIAVADALSWSEPFHMLGHSHGGGVAQVAAAVHPERIAGLVLVASMGAPAHPSYRLLSIPGAAGIAGLAGAMLRKKWLKPINQALVRLVMRDIFFPERVSPERFDREMTSLCLRPEILTSMVHVTLGRPSELLLEAASRIRCPTLFVHGGRDALVPVECARSIHERISSAAGSSHFEILPNAGHMLINYQASDLADLVLHHVGLWRMRATGRPIAETWTD